MDSETPQRLYHILEERAVLVKDGIPPAEMLSEIESALAGTHEFLIDPAMQAVIAIVSGGEPNSVTYGDIGRLWVFADRLREMAEQIIHSAATIAVVARHADTMAEGYDSDGVPVDEFGYPENRAFFRLAAKRAGFDV